MIALFDRAEARDFADVYILAQRFGTEVLPAAGIVSVPITDDGDEAAAGSRQDGRMMAKPVMDAGPSPRPARSHGAAALHAAARSAYLRGDPLDMSALAKELGVGRATLYRWGGNREELLGAVLAEATERTFRAAQREVDAGSGAAAAPTGAARVLAVVESFMRRALAAEPLKAFTQREPRLYVRLATSPGPIENRSAALVRELIQEEVDAGRMQPVLPVPTLAQALVRMGDGPLYAYLLGGGEPGIDESLAVVAVLLGLPPAPS